MSCQKIKQTGGVGFRNVYRGRDKDAFEFFMTNAASFRILTDSSISAITLIAELTPGVASPYICINPAQPNFMQAITKILLKIMPSHNIRDAKIISYANTVKRTEEHEKDDYEGFVELNSIQQISRECEIQKNLYRKSILSIKFPFMPICPSILYIENNVADPHKFKQYLVGKIEERRKTNYDGDSVIDTEIIDSFLNITIPDRLIYEQYGGVGTPPPAPAQLPSSSSNDKAVLSLQSHYSFDSSESSMSPVSSQGQGSSSQGQGSSSQGQWSSSQGQGSESLSLASSSSQSQGSSSHGQGAAAPHSPRLPQNHANYSILVMELLEGYDTFHDVYEANYNDDDIIEKIFNLASLELRRLHAFDYYHNDFHPGNVMININDLYATENHADKSLTGKAIIIDFGRTLPIGHVNLPAACKPSQTNFRSDDCLNTEKIFSKYISINTIAEGAILKQNMSRIANIRRNKVLTAFGIVDDPAITFSEVINANLPVGLLMGGGKVKKSSANKKPRPNLKIDYTQITEEAELLLMVIINSLRQTDTYAELKNYLTKYYKAYDLPELQNAKPQRIGSQGARSLKKKPSGKTNRPKTTYGKTNITNGKTYTMNRPNRETKRRRGEIPFGHSLSMHPPGFFGGGKPKNTTLKNT